MSVALYFNKRRPELRMPSVDPGVPDRNGITWHGPVGTGRLSVQEAFLQQAAEIAQRGAVTAGGPESCIWPEPKPIFVPGSDRSSNRDGCGQRECRNLENGANMGRKNAVLTGGTVKGFRAGKLMEKLVAPHETWNKTFSPCAVL